MVPANGARSRPPALAVVKRALALAAVWWTLTAGDLRGWWIGVPVVLAATAAGVRLHPPPAAWRLHARGLAGFVPYFVWRSCRGSVDVAWRALHPRLPIAPAFHTLALSLPAEGPSRVFFADAANLLPGTLSAGLAGDALTIHVLNAASPTVRSDLRRLEEKVAAVFGVDLPEAGDERSAG